MNKILSETQRGVLTLIGGFTMHLCCGVLYMWGMINIYVTSYFRHIEDSDLRAENGAVVFPVMMCAVASGMPFGVKLIKRFGSARIICYCGGAGAAACVFISSFTQYFWQFVFVYGLAFGVLTGIVYYIPIYMSYLYFPKKKGIVSGIILCGYGLSSLLFGLTFFSLVNPNNLSLAYGYDGKNLYFTGPSLSVALNVPGALRQMSFYFLVLSMAGASLIFYHPSQVGEEEKRLKQRIEENYERAVTLEEQRDLKLKLADEILRNDNEEGKVECYSSIDKDELIEMQEQANNETLLIPYLNSPPMNIGYKYEPPKLQQLQTAQSGNPNDMEAYSKRGAPRVRFALKSIRFFMSILIAILSLSIGLLINVQYKNIGKKYFQDGFLNVVGAIAAVGSGLSRPIWLSMLDKFTFKTVFSYLLGLEIFLGVTMQFSTVTSFTFILYVFLIHVTFGGVMAIFPVVSSQLFGVKIAQQIYGIYWFAFGIANFIQYGFVIQFKETIGFNGIYYIDVIFSIICLVIIRHYKLKSDWSNYYIEMNNKGIPIPPDPNQH